MEIVLLIVAGCGAVLLVLAVLARSPSRPSVGTETKAARPTDAERRARARAVGIVHRSEYLEPEVEREALTLGSDGLPTGVLERVRDRLLIVTKAGWVNPKSRSLGRVGLYSFQVRGTSYYEPAVKAADLRPGALVRLEREPENEHDANAVAIYASHGRKIGYVNKQNAPRIAKRMDTGEELVAISTRGSAPRSDEITPHILVGERRPMDHLTRRL